MTETFTFTGTARQLLEREFVPTAAGKLLAAEATVVIESEGQALVAFISRDGFQETFGRDPLEPAPEPVKEKPKPLAVAAPSEESKAPAKGKK